MIFAFLADNIEKMNIREQIEERERKILSAEASFSCRSRGRLVAEAECDLRPAFQHDRDRIIHSKAFRRLKHKTQVFFAPTGDHYRTRLTHTLEVSQIARTISKSLCLNEDLTEAVALGHDLGHTPFGHAGEDVLNEIVTGGFRHPEQSLRVVNEIEKLNLTFEVRDGILKHSKRGGPILPDNPEFLPQTLEGQVVRVADYIAYLNHDLDDAIRAKLLSQDEIKKDREGIFSVLGFSHSMRIDRLVKDVIKRSLEHRLQRIRISDELNNAAIELRKFLNDKVYYLPAVYADFEKSSKILKELYFYYMQKPEDFYSETGKNSMSDNLEKDVCDFISGMTDRYAFYAYEKLFLPKPWFVF